LRQACEEAGLVFVGPPPGAIRAMGLKAESKRLMAAAGVPLVPGYHDADQDPERLKREADRIGTRSSSRPARAVAARACG
jgi:3-methylcrotonyl-CoA carboxylase alpha subunit